MMALYKLPFAIFPIKDIYARSLDDIKQWLGAYDQNPLEVVTKSEAKIGSITDIVEVEKGELIFDFGGITAGNEYAYVDFLPDFTAKIRLESVPLFPVHQSQLKLKKNGNLYAVRNYNGSLNPLCYVPLDVFEALKRCDISAHEKRAEEHIGKLNGTLAGSSHFKVFPRVPKKGNFN
ncbi:MAG: hypothetical protein Q8R47_06320 [Nanoarchaeota archaeon]|nr:hypothetical protein [Nanoarchaeota archaeon]